MQAKLKEKMNDKSKEIYDSFPKDLKDFYHFHGAQLYGCRFPMELVQMLYAKMSKAIYDVGEYFEIIDDDQHETFSLRAKTDIPASGAVFIIEHALTFRYPDLRRVLHENPSLIPRTLEMLKYQKTSKKLPGYEEEHKPIGAAGNFTEIEFDSMELTELSHLEFPNNTVTLSLVGNQLTNEEELINKMQYLDLKVLWVNGNPLEDSEVLAEYVNEKSKIEIFNSKFTKHCSEWGIKYCQRRKLVDAFQENAKDMVSLNLDERDIFVIDVDVLTKFTNLTTLSLKGHSLSKEENKKVILHILESNPKLRFLWVDFEAEVTLFELFESKEISKEIAERVLINGHSLLCKEATLEDLQIDQIHRNIFKIAGCYRLASTQQLDESSIWYINDEVGSSIQHSDQGNVHMVPFLFAEDNKIGPNMWAYSIMWPTKPIQAGDLLYRDYLHGFTEQRQRSARLAIWYDLPQEFFLNRYQQFQKKCRNLERETSNTISNFYKENSERQRQLIKKKSESNQLYLQSIKLVSDLDIVLDNLSHSQIEVVKTMEEADAIWLAGALDEEKWQEVLGKYYINQFPFESCIVMKHNLADTIQSVFGNTPYLMRTYNLETQLSEFVGEFYNREKKGEDNLWILKPPNMARSLDMIITDNLSLVIKSMETGPKIAQKYIRQPVLRQGRKIDLRYILLVQSVKPLTLYLYKHFWIRSSNNPYTLDRRQLSTYETQFTVMNYGAVSDFKQIKYVDFIQEFERDYAPVKWSQMDEKIKKMLRNTFVAAGIKFPGMHSEKSRAIYGIDVMIDSENMEPKLLEITFSPDCKRACQYYPTFYNEVMQTLFLNTIGDNMERVI